MNGNADLIASSGWYLKIYLNQGNGSFETTPSYTLELGGNCCDFALADLNRDGFVDIVACTLNEARVWFNNNGTFNELPDQAFSYLSSGFSQVALGEINYDGYPDLAGCTDVYVHIFENDHGTGFNTTPVWTSDNLGQWYGLICGINELVFADLGNLGGHSLLGAAIGGEPGMDPLYTTIVFKELSNPRVRPIRNFQVIESVPERHPVLSWLPNKEFDICKYRIYRALMPDETPPVREDFDLIDSVYHDTSTYTDYDVYMLPEYANYKIWYMVTAVDSTDHESLASEFIRFWGLYHPQSEDSMMEFIGAAQPDGYHTSISPNPFNPTTTISFALPEASHVKLTVFDLQGRVVTELVNGMRDAGVHEVTLDAGDLSSGLYFYRINAGDFSSVRKMILMK